MTGTAMILAAAAPKSSSSATSYLLIFVLIAVMMLVFFRSNRRRQQTAQNTQRQVTNGARVVTVHGIYGTVRDGDDKNLMIEVAPGVQIKMLRQAVRQVLPDDTPDGVLNTMPDTDAAGSAPGEADEQAEGDDASARPQQSSDLNR
jgi:preprotein translocase subunit YajC